MRPSCRSVNSGPFTTTNGLAPSLEGDLFGDGGDDLAVKQNADNIKQTNQSVIVANEEVASVS